MVVVVVVVVSFDMMCSFGMTALCALCAAAVQRAPALRFGGSTGG